MDKKRLAHISTTYVMLALAGIIGGGGLLTFMVFLLAGPLNLVDHGLREPLVLLFDAVLCLVFFIQHSLMARKPFRIQLARFLPVQYTGALYAVASGIFVLVLVVFWQESAYTLITLQGAVRWIFRSAYVLAIAGVAWTIWALGFFVNFRLQPMMDDLRSKQTSPVLITDRGPYRWVRHPLYLSSLLMIWSYPDLTLDRLLFNYLFTGWVIIAIILEERGLVAAFGESYRSYQRKVPMLIPWRLYPRRDHIQEGITLEQYKMMK
jgi:protein-S-isoprenylcysteine O-methyltransferase Ste14